MMYNLRIIKSGDRLEIYKINNYVISESKKDEGHVIIDKLLDELSGEEAQILKKSNLKKIELET